MTDPQPADADPRTQVLDTVGGVFRVPLLEVADHLDRACAPDTRWDFYHPFEPALSGADAAAGFWTPLRQAMPNAEFRSIACLSGEFDGGQWVSVLGHVIGSLDHPWLGVPATHGMVFLRMALNVRLVDGQIAQAYVHFDLIDLMLQAGVYPFRRMPGSSAQWPAPPFLPGSRILDPDLSASTMKIMIDMQESMGFDLDPDNPATEQHSPLWARDMNWFGPAGIGSTRGEFEFLNYHCAPLEVGFPDLTFPFIFDGRPDLAAGRRSNPNHYLQLAEGQLGVTGGWPSLAGTHTGAGFLGLPPTFQVVRMRVADWYRVDDHGLIVDNWVMIDIPHIVHQCGFDLLKDLSYIVDPTIERRVPLALNPRR